jgi:hypothetical protein
VILVRSNLGSNQIDVERCTWPRSVPTEPFRVESVKVEVSVKLIFSLASSEDEGTDYYGGENTDGTSDDNITGDGRGIQGQSTIRGLRLCREDELGGSRWLRLDLAVRVSGSGNRVGKKASATVPDSETKGHHDDRTKR